MEKNRKFNPSNWLYILSMICTLFVYIFIDKGTNYLEIIKWTLFSILVILWAIYNELKFK